MQNRCLLLSLGLVGMTGLTSTPVQAQTPRPLIGPQVGFYTPTSALAKNRFGSSWTNIGFGLGDIEAAKEKGEVSFDVNFLSSNKKNATVGSTEALLVPIGLRYRRGLEGGSNAHPYYGVSVNLLLSKVRSDIKVPAEGINDNVASRWRTTQGASLFAGVSLGKRFSIEARYYAFGKVEQFDFSGYNLSVGWRI